MIEIIYCENPADFPKGKDTDSHSDRAFENRSEPSARGT
jgi:hypothetical protein